MPTAPVELLIDPTAAVDLAILPAALPRDARPGDVVAVRPVLAPSSKGKGKDRPLLYKVERASDADDGSPASAGGGGGDALAQARRRGKAQVTVSPTLAQSFSWVKNRCPVQLSLIPSPPPKKLCASHVELYFNNLYLSRPDGFALSLALNGKVLHTGQRVALPGSGARLRVGDMWSSTSASHAATSGSRGGASSSSSPQAKNTRLDASCITDETKFVFRSESARAYILVEVSQELWQFEEDGSMLLEKCELFLHELWSHYSGKMSTEAEDRRSKGVATSHVASIILFGRVMYDDAADAEEERAPLSQLEDGTLYRDFYKVIVDLTPSPPASIIHSVALELRRWQSTVLLRTRPDGSERLSGRLASAHESPILEAANLPLNSFEEHWIDRDLQRTGQEIIVVTAGTTFYHVEKSALRITTERMLFHGIGLDIISLSKMPLHTIPLFQFRSPDPSAAELSIAVNDSSVALPTKAAGPSSQAPPGSSTLSNSLARSPAAGPSHRVTLSSSAAFRPSSLRQAHGFASASPPLRDPRALSATDDAVSTISTAPARIAPIQVPDDQRDPLYFDPPPPRTASVAPHARTPSATLAGAAVVPLPASSSFATSSPFSAPARPSSTSTNPLARLAPGPAPPGSALETSLYYHEPMFVFPHFFGTQIDKPHRLDRFMPRARCYELTSQGVTEHVPLALPLLSLGGATDPDALSPDSEAGKAGFLSEHEQRQQRRDRYDALALGARDPAELFGADGLGSGAAGARGGARIGMDQAGAWADERESGATTSGTGTGTEETGTSESEVERSQQEEEGRESAPRRSEADDEESDTFGDEISSRGGGAEALGVGLPARSAQTSRASLRSDDGDGDGSRGRRSGRETPSRIKHEVGRSKTPVPRSGSQRRPRSTSIAASVRTVSSAFGKADSSNASTAGSQAARKASTPALIARLTGAPGPSTTSSASASTKAPSSTHSANRPTWLNLFGRAHTLSNVSSPAAQVAVARVDVQANLRPDAPASSDKAGSETATDDSTAADHPVLGFSSASQRPSSRSRSRADLSARSTAGSSSTGKTQPISIGSKLGPSGSSHPAGAAEKARGRTGAGGSQAGSGSNKGSVRMSTSLRAYELSGSRKGFGSAGGKVSVSARFNPSKPGKRSVGLADQARRWAGILVIERRSLRLGVKWRSITRGAILPTTTDYLPSADMLASQYSEVRYTVPTASVTSSFLLRADHPKRSHILTLVTELICQRLAQGFQICTPANAAGALDAIHAATAKTLPDVLRDIGDGEVTAVYLSLSNQIHRIWYDRRAQAVFVKILRRKRTWSKQDYAYRPLIWTRGRSNYESTPLSFPYPVMLDPLEWQHADRLVAGAEKPEAPDGQHQAVRYRRTRLVLLPATKVPDRDYVVGTNKALQGVEISDAAIQAQGFYVLMEVIENARWAPAGVEKEPLSTIQTTLDAPGWAASIAQQQQQQQSSHSSDPNSPATPATNPQPPTAAPRSTWLSRMQSRASVATGSSKGDDPTASPLVTAQSDRDLDLPPPALDLPALTPTRSNATTSTSRSDVASRQSPAIPPASSASTTPPTPQRQTVQMTHAVVLDLDPSRRSDRAERVLCHLDRSHNVRAAYHVEFAWLTASGRIVDNVVQNWTRQMARYGLNLVEVSMRPVLDRHNPFHKPAMISPKLLPPVDAIASSKAGDEASEEAGEGHKEAPTAETYLARLLRSLDFFLDLGADSTFPSFLDVQYSYRRVPTLHSQYIHRSGTVLVSICEDDDGRPAYAYAPNRVWTNHRPELDAKQPMEALVELCGDEERLQRLYDEVREEGL
ncbi:uncharacterized protein JCM10292_002923 [Rhodotorula paludigena]|uniref:uncharacterized protein n=1 Tax=Rhodotorula paludigena TaxID=86838 RepID=UPI0031787D22